jgi:hypothetical protein
LNYYSWSQKHDTSYASSKNMLRCDQMVICWYSKADVNATWRQQTPNGVFTKASRQLVEQTFSASTFRWTAARTLWTWLWLLSSRRRASPWTENL